MTVDKKPVYITVGKVGAPYGVRGWVKVFAYTEQADNLLDYDPWYILCSSSCSQSNSKPNQVNNHSEWCIADVVEAKQHGKGLVAKFKNCDDRDAAALLNGQQIAIQRDQLPQAQEDEYYWIDLEGLEVKTMDGVSLGIVDHLLETGANDVLVVKGDRERLIPYVKDHIVKSVDLENSVIQVDWEADYDD